MGLIAELRRRNVLRMAALYVVAAWLVMQVAEVVIGLANLPDWLGPAVLVLLAIGLPIALIFSWFFEVTPEGLSLEKDVPEGQSITHVTGRRMDFVIIAILSAGLLLFAYDKWWPRDPLELSIAVLPFENMSADPEQEFFSDGISEQILDRLAQIQQLKVIARTSSFSFKGKDVDIATIAERLNVRHILEGSVRRSADRVRITAQLIDAKNSSHIWSQTFDRDFADVFAVQDEIAAAVTDALRVRLVREIPETRTTSPDVYELYLQAKYLVVRSRSSSEVHCLKAQSLLTQALERDPQFAPAWAELSRTYSSNYSCGNVYDFHELAENRRYAAEQALSIDPENALAHSLLARVAMNYDWDFRSAADHLDRALEINSGSAQTLVDAARLARILNNPREAVRLTRRAAALNPTEWQLLYALGFYQYLSGEFEEAIDSLQQALRFGPNRWGIRFKLGMAYLALGDANAALETIRTEPIEGLRLTGEAIVQFELGAIEESDAALQQLIEDHKDYYAYQIAYVHSSRGEIDQAFHWLEESYRIRDNGLPELLAEPMFVNLHDDPRWGAFLDKLGLPH